MRSHSYNFSAADVRKFVAAPLLMVFTLIIAAQCLRIANIFGPIESPEYLEDIIIRQKSIAAREPVNPEALFVGDSSCLMDFSARDLERILPGVTCYNLGSLSTLGLPKFGEFTARFLAVHTNVKTVVLLISPEMVRSGSAGQSAPALLRPDVQQELALLRREHERAQKMLDTEARRAALVPNALALPFMRTQLVARVFETPYPGALGNFYGFPSGVGEFMKIHNGSAVDPMAEFKPAGSRPEATDALTGFAGEPFRAQCAAFRAILPSGVKLWVGLTPEPVSVCSQQRAEEIRRTLLTLKKYLRADRILTRLPGTFPDQYFSTTTHLNPSGARQFTHALAGAVEGAWAAIAQESEARSNLQAKGSAAGFVSGKSE